jgi:hypothetical protein
VAADGIDETLECCPVVQVLARMDLERHVDAGLVERVEDGTPANDEMAIGLMRTLALAGIRVPQDISVAGFDATSSLRPWPTRH